MIIQTGLSIQHVQRLTVFVWLPPLSSATPLLPASGPHWEAGGLLRPARALAGQLRVPRHGGLLQGKAVELTRGRLVETISGCNRNAISSTNVAIFLFIVPYVLFYSLDKQ